MSTPTAIMTPPATEPPPWATRTSDWTPDGVGDTWDRTHEREAGPWKVFAIEYWDPGSTVTVTGTVTVGPFLEAHFGDVTNLSEAPAITAALQGLYEAVAA